jgi:transposase-like protein
VTSGDKGGCPVILYFACVPGRLPWLRSITESTSPVMVKQPGKDLPELLSFMNFPKTQRMQLRTTNVIERCFVEVRRRIRPMVCFVNVGSVDRIIYSIFHRFNLEWETHTLRSFTQATLTKAP